MISNPLYRGEGRGGVGGGLTLIGALSRLHHCPLACHNEYNANDVKFIYAHLVLIDAHLLRTGLRP